jgi:hypothetical protein
MVQLSCQRFNRVHRFPNGAPGFCFFSRNQSQSSSLKATVVPTFGGYGKVKTGFFPRKIQEIRAKMEEG